MAVGRTARLTPLQQEMVPVNNAALVIGGGVAGMTAALTLADQGFPVHLVEKDTNLAELPGNSITRSTVVIFRRFWPRRSAMSQTIRG